ncbi:hypothetical protein DFH29DRAFT_1076935 [Suillus ampliporus]|nr:hypothetical protein DFH29DRAFT_1076935 [Suillus ampliporus]
MLIHSAEQDIIKFPGVIHPRKSIFVQIPHTSHLTSSTSSLPASGSSTLHLVTASNANANILCFDGGSTGTGLCFGRPGDDDAETMRAVQSSMPGGIGGDAVEAGDVDVETFYPESDLDLYAHPGHVYELVEWLESVGYKFEPSQYQEKDWHSHVSVDWDGTVKRTNRADRALAHDLDLMWYPDIAGVYTFKRFVAMDGATVELKVQVMETTCNPIEAIMKFHSTCVMNIITFDAAYSFYPVATFEERSALKIPGSRHRPDVIEKYVKRGWRVYAVFRPGDIMRLCTSPFFPNKTWWVGDRHCWSIPLDTSGVKPRPALSQSSEQFPWDPSIHNGWIMSYEDSRVAGQKEPVMNAHLVMSTIFRYNYIFPNETLALAIRAWSISQGKLNHLTLMREDWTWFDAEIPRFREVQDWAELTGAV